MPTSQTADLITQRQRLVEQIRRQGIRDPRVLEAIGSVRREAFVPVDLEEFAYRDIPLPIGKEQTISQPFVVALMADVLQLEASDRVLEVGTGSGYAAAVLSHLCAEVYSIERFADLADSAKARLIAEGFDQVHVRHGDGTRGWPEEAPFDAMTVAAGGRHAPTPLLDQLAIGGRLVIPLGPHRSSQVLTRITKLGKDEFDVEEFGGVRFVPLVGVSGWDGEESDWDGRPEPAPLTEQQVPARIAEVAESFDSIESADLTGVLDRIGDCRLVLIGEASHGTSEFYEMRARITKELISQKHFDFVAIEADWPDASRIDRYVRGFENDQKPWQAFSRFPTWMWRNEETLRFIDWLREHNASQPNRDKRVGFHGLDLYSLYTSLHRVLEYLDDVDPETAAVARQRYECLTPWQEDPQSYGLAAVTGKYRDCEDEAVEILQDLLRSRLAYTKHDGDRYFDATRNAQLVADAEKYYRVMYYGGVQSWNLRDQHMFETLQSIRGFYDRKDGPSKGIVWAHNSHLGDASATEMGKRGEWNIGQLCRAEFGTSVYLIGQATHHGTVAAASKWGGAIQAKDVRPSRADSYEQWCHRSGVPRFFLPLRQSPDPELIDALRPSKLQRAIGVIYRPETELQSHYFHARLPHQFDEWIWFDKTHAIRELAAEHSRRHPPEHPFAFID